MHRRLLCLPAVSGLLRPMDDARQADAAVVFVHGNDGTPQDWDCFESILVSHHQRRFPGKRLAVLKSAVNKRDTHIGISNMGCLLAAEICDFMSAEKVGEGSALCLVGHSLGGIKGRFALGQLLTQGFLAGMHLCAFMSLCSPHLGVRAPPLSEGLSMRSFINLASVCGQTEKELVLEDVDPAEHGPPILASMADPELHFMQALSLFQRRIAVGLIKYDMLVPFSSATMCLGYSGPGVEGAECSWALADPSFVSLCAADPLVHHEGIEYRDAKMPRQTQWVSARTEAQGWLPDDEKEVNLPYEMMRELVALGWYRVPISFHTPETGGLLARLVGHNFIINKKQAKAAKPLAEAAITRLVELLLDELQLVYEGKVSPVEYRDGEGWAAGDHCPENEYKLRVLRTKKGTPIAGFPDWEERSTLAGEVFYVNHATRSTHWEHPKALT